MRSSIKFFDNLQLSFIEAFYLLIGDSNNREYEKKEIPYRWGVTI